MKFHFVTADEQ